MLGVEKLQIKTHLRLLLKIIRLANQSQLSIFMKLEAMRPQD